MASSYVNSATGIRTSSNSTVVTGGMNCTAGNSIIVAVVFGSTSDGSISVSDSAGNTYTAVDNRVSRTSDPPGLITQLFLANNIASYTGNVITGTFARSVSYSAISASQYSADADLVLDAYPTPVYTDTDTVRTRTSNSFTTLQNSSLVFVACAVDGDPSGWTPGAIDSQTLNSRSGTMMLGTADYIFSSIQTNITATMSWSGDNTGCVLFVAVFSDVIASSHHLCSPIYGPFHGSLRGPVQ